MRDRPRRELLKRIGVVGAASVLPAGVLAAAGPSAAGTLDAAQADTLEAIVARLIPTDENGPGAAEARAARYIDRALAGALSSAREAYVAGLAALNAHALASKGAPFAKLDAKDQDMVLRDVENDLAKGFTPSSSAFFDLVRRHTLQGMFCDPYYGGNANFAGWRLIGYPGIRMSVTAQEQRLGVAVAPDYRSAYDYPMFRKSGDGRDR